MFRGIHVGIIYCMTIRSVIVLIFASLVLFQPNLNADPLEEVIQSEEYQDLKKSVDSNREKLDQWVDPTSDYGRVLLNSDKSSELSEWLHQPPMSLIEKKRLVKRHKEYLEVAHHYKGVEKDALLTLAFFIPFPKFGPMSDHGLVSDLNSLEPPVLTARSSEDIKVGELSGKLFHEFSNECSILIRLPKFTRVQGKISSCSNIRLLTELLESIGIEEVARRLAGEAIKTTEE